MHSAGSVVSASYSQLSDLPPESETTCFYAALVIHDASSGYQCEAYPHTGNISKVSACTHVHDRLSKASVTAMIVSFFLMFFETPLWCTNSVGSWSFVEQCDYADGSKTQSFGGLLVLSPSVALCVELCCTLVLMAFHMHEYWLNRIIGVMRSRGPLPIVWCSVLSLELLDIFIFSVLSVSGRHPSFRLSPYCRLAIFLSVYKVRNVFYSAFTCLKTFCSIVWFIFLAITLFGWIIAMILHDVGVRDVAGFETIFQSMWSLFQMQTGKTFPDSSNALVLRYPQMTLLTVPFMILTYFLFSNLMLAVVYKAYQQDTQLRLREFYSNRNKGKVEAFRRISSEVGGRRGVSKVAYEQVVACLNSFPSWKRTSAEQAQILFDTVDEEGTGFLNFQEFAWCCDLWQYKFYTTPSSSLLLRHFGWGASVKRFIEQGQLELITNCVLCVNVLFIAVETFYDFTCGLATDTCVPTFCDVAEDFFSCVYLVEVGLNISTLSFRNYWSKTHNRFDFVISWFLFLADLGKIITSRTGGTIGFGDIQLSHEFKTMLPYLNILRVLRLVKLLERIPSFEKMSSCVFLLVTISSDMFALISLTLTFFAVIGVQSTGGRITSDAVLDGTAPDNLIYTFDDMTTSCLALLSVLVNAWMPEYSVAIDQVNRLHEIPVVGRFVGPHFGKLYCVTFFFLGVNVALNIFIAFTIDLFVIIDSMEESGAAFRSAQDKHIQEMEKVWRSRDCVLHSVMPTFLVRIQVLSKCLEIDLEKIEDDW